MAEDRGERERARASRRGRIRSNRVKSQGKPIVGKITLQEIERAGPARNSESRACGRRSSRPGFPSPTVRMSMPLHGVCDQVAEGNRSDQVGGDDGQHRKGERAVGEEIHWSRPIFSFLMAGLPRNAPRRDSKISLAVA